MISLNAQAGRCAPSAVALALCIALAGCAAETPAPPIPDDAAAAPAPTAAAAPAVLLYGQRGRVDGRDLFDPDRPPRIRVEAPAGRFTFYWNDAPLPAEGAPRDGGLLFTLPVPPPGDARLTLRATDEPAARPLASWAVRSVPRPADLPVIADAVALRTGGDPRAAAALLEARMADLDPGITHHAWFELGRARRQLGDLAGTAEAWSEALDRALAGNDRIFGGAALRSLAWLAVWRRDLVTAQAHLERAADLLDAEHDVEGALKLAYNRGLVEAESGDYAAARRRLEQARAGAARLGLERLVATIDQQRMAVLSALRRYEEGLAIEAAPGDGWAVNNRGWLMLEAMDAGAVPVDHARVERLFRRARAVFRAEGNRAFAAVPAANLAWLALRRGDYADARTIVREDCADVDTDLVRRFVELIEAELATAEGRGSEALAIYRRIEDNPYHPGGWDVRWRAALGRARLHRAAGRQDAALAAYRRALARLDELGRGAGVREDRARFFGDRRALVDEAIEALLAAGRTVEAFVVADGARARVLRALEAGVRVGRLSDRDRTQWLETHRDYADATAELQTLHDRRRRTWRASRQAVIDARIAALAERRAAAFEDGWRLLLRGAPSDGDGPVDPRALQAVLGADGALVATRRRGTGHDVFWVRGGPAGGVEHHHTTGDLLAPWIAALSDLRRLHLVVPGHEMAGHIEARPVDGAPLGTRIAIMRAPFAGLLAAKGVNSPRGRAVVVADPRGDLPQAAQEARWVHDRLGGRLLAGASATPDAVLAALDGAPLFHFAGHGDLRAGSPWDAHLRLAGAGRLTLESILFARPRVGLVVLNGCETGARLAMAGHESIGLPEAFLATGSEAVLATRRTVGDAEARRFVEHFYRAGGADDPARGLLAARRALHAAGDPVWTAFELWSR